MSNKSYQQFCALSQALDMIGQRWTLLIIRELLTGPKRFNALMNQLPGIGSNLLSGRLKDLEQHGLITTASHTNQTRYTLTARGEALRPTVHALLSWGNPLLHALPQAAQSFFFSRSWLHLALQQALAPTIHQPSACYTFIIDEEILQVRIADGQVHIPPDASFKPDLVVRCTSEHFVAILTGKRTLKESLKAGNINYEGNLEDFIQVFEKLRSAH